MQKKKKKKKPINDTNNLLVNESYLINYCCHNKKNTLINLPETLN